MKFLIFGCSDMPIKKIKSHPDKLLLEHVNGVLNNVKSLSPHDRIAQLATIFHDIGKINPNFQKKLFSKSNGYSNHAYLSAYLFWVFHYKNRHSNIFIDLDVNDIIGIIVIIAKHHGHLPDFTPQSNNENIGYILSTDEINNVLEFVSNPLLLVEDYVRVFFSDFTPFLVSLGDPKVKEIFSKRLKFKCTEDPLQYFLTTQSSFASLIQADKADAMRSNVIEKDSKNVATFCKTYSKTLNDFISKFDSSSDINRVRTEIREEAVKGLEKNLQENQQRVFELTSPTGSGKTIMLLSLASKIIESKGAYRIMFALPFLSITEQVEGVVKEIFADSSNYIQRIDSKSTNPKFEEIQSKLDGKVDSKDIKQMDLLAFQEQVFAYPFIITTFVRLIETLFSNRNATLLKLPNFSKCIFLIDEIQSIPPRLYTFFVGYLSRFCELHDSYAIVSTATQPKFDIPNDKKDFFKTENPIALLDHRNYFKEVQVFNRYTIDYNRDQIDLEGLSKKILAEKDSTLVILNTIDDTKELYTLLSDDCKNIFLLNTHFTPKDRKEKINIVKEKLKSDDEKIILISTQLIEAGVDIDFPVLYRDFALVPSIVQSAGRCNRNGKLTMGKVVLFHLYKNNKERAALIYGQGSNERILQFTREALGNKNKFQEKDLLEIQNNFFKRIWSDLNFGVHEQSDNSFNFVKDIKECLYRKIGSFRLIDNDQYGDVRQYYVPENKSDSNFEDLLSLSQSIQDLPFESTWDDYNALKIKIKSNLKKMSNQIVQIRIKQNQTAPILGNEKDFNGIYKLSLDAYSFVNGVLIDGDNIL